MRKLDIFLWSVVVFFVIITIQIIVTSYDQTPARLGVMLAFPIVMVYVTLMVIFFGGYKSENKKISLIYHNTIRACVTSNNIRMLMYEFRI